MLANLKCCFKYNYEKKHFLGENVMIDLKYKLILFVVSLSLVLFVLFKYNFFILERKKINGKPLFKKGLEFTMDKQKIRKVKLENGMTILVFKNEATPKVLLQIAYDVGSWVEHVGERGLAHLIEHMIFKGTKKLSEGDIDAISRKYGATFNAFTGKDITSYYFEVNKNNWHPFVTILADCMQNARFESQHLASEFKTVIQELKLYKDRHWSRMLEKAYEISYPSNHPYHFPIIGYKEDLVSLTAQNLKKFYKKYYGPERATLFIVGDVDIDQAVDIARQNFADIKIENDLEINYDKFKKDKFPDIFQGLIKNQTSIYEEVKKEQLGFYWLIPGLKEKNDVLVSVVEFILGQGEGSRLYRRLVEEEKVAVAVVAMADQLVESGIFLILVEPVDGKADMCQKIVKEELDKLIAQGVSSDDLNKMIRSRGREFSQRLQSLSNFTYEWLQSYISTKDEFDIFEKVNRFVQINSEQIQSFVKSYLDPFLINRIEVLPLPEDKKEIWQKAKEESEKLDLEILQSHQRTEPLEEPKFVKTLPDPNPMDFSYPKPDLTFELDNGLTVILEKNGQWPILNMKCRFKHASFFAEAKDGILVDFMMSNLMEGSSSYSKNDNVDFFERFGAGYSFDSFGGSVSSLNECYKDVFERFFCILTEPVFPSTQMEKIKNINIDVFQRRKDSNTTMAIRLIKNLIYKSHPYDWTFDDAIDLIKNGTVEKLKSLHSKYVNPCNMILTVVGCFDLNEMKNNIIKIFGDWKKGECQTVEYPESKFDPEKKVDHFMLRDQVVLAFGRPSEIDVYHPDLVPVKLLDFISFSSLGSRLYKLRERTGLFYAASGSFAEGASREHGFDYVGAILTLDKVDFAQKEILNTIDEIGKNGVKKYELDAARQQYFKALIDFTSSNEAISSMFSILQSLGLGFDYYDKVLKRVQTISLEELNQIAKKYFVSKDMTRVRVGRIGK
ncbi:insulinase family protein [Candidatus Babeliales bacterium]|nr:insulinase family protein [Candidatus Babeliales bacterium]